jgi:hypothetical protein
MSLGPDWAEAYNHLTQSAMVARRYMVQSGFTL